jgi:hypothetical protein
MKIIKKIIKKSFKYLIRVLVETFVFCGVTHLTFLMIGILECGKGYLLYMDSEYVLIFTTVYVLTAPLRSFIHAYQSTLST